MLVRVDRDMAEKLRASFGAVRKYPQGFLPEVTLGAAGAFVMGYLQALPDDVFAELKRWFGEQYERPELAFWGHIAQDIVGTEAVPAVGSLSVEDHRAAVDRLLQRLEEFGASNAGPESAPDDAEVV